MKVNNPLYINKLLENTNHKWTIKRNWQYSVHKTQGNDKQNKNTTQYVLDTNPPNENLKLLFGIKFLNLF